MSFRILLRNLQKTVRLRISDSRTILSSDRLLWAQLCLEDLAQDVPGKDVGFLDAWQIA